MLLLFPLEVLGEMIVTASYAKHKLLLLYLSEVFVP